MIQRILGEGPSQFLGQSSDTGGITSSPTAVTATAAKFKRIVTPRSGVQQITVTTPAAGGVVKAGALKLAPGMVVDVYPASANTATIYSGLGPSEAQYGPNAGHAQGSQPVTYHVHNLGDIWLYASSAQGALLVVRPL